ncbi:MAG TPA: winged helix-turn-helix domain-containing protein [Streptosporangiaceae bacterium]|jgi:GntR family transcriptional regulator|nr:winged helix-turn-helix domain-containing protein [Streptosporangiaceae bacterium]
MADWSGRPAYLQVADDLRAGILKGRYKPGSQLPSYGALMEHYGVSITVVRSAIRELRTQSLVRTHQGKGVFVSDPLPVIRRAGPEGPTDTAVRVEKLESEIASLRETMALLQAQLINLYHSTGQPYPYEEGITTSGRRVG